MAAEEQPLPAAWGDELGERSYKISIVSILVFSFKCFCLACALNVLLGVIPRIYYCAREWLKPASVRRHSTMTQFRQCSQNVREIAGGLALYRLSHGQYPLSHYELVPDFMAQIPRCPASKRMTYRTTFSPDGSFVTACAGNSHSAVGEPPNSPSWVHPTGSKSSRAKERP